jgi:hypothetical protein
MLPLAADVRQQLASSGSTQQQRALVLREALGQKAGRYQFAFLRKCRIAQ